jgi:hypothetical protein
MIGAGIPSGWCPCGFEIVSAFSLISPSIERGSGVQELNILEAFLKGPEYSI